MVFAELPGVERDAIELSFEQNLLTIRGTKHPGIEATPQGDLHVYQSERVHGGFERSIRLPDWVDGDDIRAEFQNDLLTVTVPKAQAAQPRKIEIGTGMQGQIAA